MTAYVAVSAATPSASMNDGSVGGPSGVPVRCAKPLIASPRGPNPGQSDFGPPAPYPVTCTMTSLGLAAARLSYARSHFCSVDGRRFMISTSACRVSDRSRSRPASTRRLRVTHFLLRATLFHISPIPSRCAPHCRSGSPPSGCSTLITSAPCSPIQVAISGPAARVAASITRSPARAPSVTEDSLLGGVRIWRDRQPSRPPAGRRAGGARDAQRGGYPVRPGRGRRGACLTGVERPQQQAGGAAGQLGVRDLDHRKRRVRQDEPGRVAVDDERQVAGEPAAAAADRLRCANRQRAAADHERGAGYGPVEQLAGGVLAVLLRRLCQPHRDPAGI